jgi:hypothetical protein
MKTILGLLISLVLSLSALAAPKISAPKVPPVDISFDLEGQPVSQIMRIIYIEAFRERPYFLDAAVLQDQRPISFRYRCRSSNGFRRRL